jgi:hypothetical protein
MANDERQSNFNLNFTEIFGVNSTNEKLHRSFKLKITEILGAQARPLFGQ